MQDSWPDNRLGETGATHQWPKSEITEPGPVAGGTWDLHYATELEAGWLAAWDAEWGEGFGMTFPADLFRCVWVWLADGGWRGIRCAAVEPWIGFPGRLDEAIAAGRAYQLGAGEVLTAETRLIVEVPRHRITRRVTSKVSRQELRATYAGPRRAARPDEGNCS